MDIMSALASVGQAIKIAKDLREIERDMDSASYKAKAADLYSNLADLKMALTDAKEELHEKDTVIKKLQAEIDTLKSGETCPLCGVGRLQVTASRADPTFGVFGHQQRTLTCQNAECGHSEMRKIVPA